MPDERIYQGPDELEVFLGLKGRFDARSLARWSRSGKRLDSVIPSKAKKPFKRSLIFEGIIILTKNLSASSIVSNGCKVEWIVKQDS